MRAKYITCFARDLVVINGQAYYRSTGKNSTLGEAKLAKCFIPFVLVMEHQEIAEPSYGKLTDFADIYNLYRLSNEFAYLKKNGYYEKVGYLVKIRAGIMHTEIVAADGIFKMADDKLTDREKLIRERLITKKFLITSSQLNPGYYTDAELKKAGLSPEQIVEAKTPIELSLDTTYESKTNINIWLLKQGATHVTEPLQLRLGAAARDGRVHELKEILQHYPEWMHHQFPDGNNLLILAIYNNRSEVTEILIQGGVTLAKVNPLSLYEGDFIYRFFLYSLNTQQSCFDLATKLELNLSKISVTAENTILKYIFENLNCLIKSGKVDLSLIRDIFDLLPRQKENFGKKLIEFLQDKVTSAEVLPIEAIQLIEERSKSTFKSEYLVKLGHKAGETKPTKDVTTFFASVPAQQKLSRLEASAIRLIDRSMNDLATHLKRLEKNKSDDPSMPYMQTIKEIAESKSGYSEKVNLIKKTISSYELTVTTRSRGRSNVSVKKSSYF